MKIHWTSCADCEFGAVERVPRKLWMRLLPSMRYYRCSQCESFVLARKDVVEAKKWMLSTFKNYRAPPLLDEGEQRPG